MPKRSIYDNDRHAQFITFTCFKRRKLLNTDPAKRIIIGTLGSQLATHEGLCIGFVIMPEHVHCLVWFDETDPAWQSRYYPFNVFTEK